MYCHHSWMNYILGYLGSSSNFWKFPNPPLIFPMVLKRKRRWQGRSPNPKSVPWPSQAFQHLEHMLDGNRLMTNLGNLQWDTIETSPSTQSRIFEAIKMPCAINRQVSSNVFNIFNFDSCRIHFKEKLCLSPVARCASRRAPRCESQISSKPSIKHWRIASGANPRSLTLLLSTGDLWVQLRKLYCYWKQHHGTRVSIDLCKEMWRRKNTKVNPFSSDLSEPEKYEENIKSSDEANNSCRNWEHERTQVISK